MSFADDCAERAPEAEAPLSEIIARINGAATKPVGNPFEVLGTWLANGRPDRYVREIRQLPDGSWRVSLQGRLRAYGCDSKQGLENAIRTAVGVAWTNGER